MSLHRSTMRPPATRAFIGVVDDDKDVLDLVKDMLEAEGHLVLPFTEGPPALRAFETGPFDLVIADIRMPQMDGIELLRRLRQKSDVPAILLTGSGQEIDELVGLRIGADDFIRKPFSAQVLIERVGTVLRRPRSASPAGDKQFSENVIVCGHLRLDKDRHTSVWKGRPVELTATEFRLLESLAIQPGMVKGRETLAGIIGDDQAAIYSRSLDTHIKRLRQKFRAVDETFNEIDTVYGVGYQFSRIKN
jgi:two-component system response regulator ChvI